MSLLHQVVSVVFAAGTTVIPFFGNTPISSHPLQPSLTFGTLSPVSKPAVLGASSEKTISSPKKHYTIALLGDSMIDTLGNNAPDLSSGLTVFFPNDTFTLLNYGVGATNIDYGIQRITNSYTYQGQTIPSLISRRPDIVIVESFGYNPYANSADNLPRYKEQLANLMHVLKTNLPKALVVFAVTIAPNSNKFGDGAPAIQFSAEEKMARTKVIKQYLQTAVNFAKENKLPLVDAYDASLTNTGDGDLTYISGADHIHYSAIGRMLFTQKIIEALTTSRLIQ